MKAITTKYLGPSNVRGSRIKAFDSDGNSVTIGVANSLRVDENHRAAAQALMTKMNWTGEIVSGSVKDGMVWVFTEKTAPPVSPKRFPTRSAWQRTGWEIAHLSREGRSEYFDGMGFTRDRGLALAFATKTKAMDVARRLGVRVAIVPASYGDMAVEGALRGAE